MEKFNEVGAHGSEPLRLIHYHPGYFRAQASLFVGVAEDHPAVVVARTTASLTDGFLKWSHSPRSGSFVVEYQPGLLDVDELMAEIAKQVGLKGVVTDIHSTVHRTQLVNGLIDAVENMNEIVYRATDGRTDLRELVPAALMVTSVISFILGKSKGRLPSWDSSLYRSYKLFMQFHKDEIKKRNKKRGKI